MEKGIVIQGARQNNLKNISLTLPRNKLIVFSGLSGSGKSSSPSIRSMRKGSGNMWSLCPPMRGSFSGR